jgi:hypothetical protein
MMPHSVFLLLSLSTITQFSYSVEFHFCHFTQFIQFRSNFDYSKGVYCCRINIHVCCHDNSHTTHIYYYWWGGTKSLGTAATSGLLYKPQMIDEDDCGTIGGMKIGRGNRSTQRKPALAPLCPPQIPHDQTRARTWAAALGSQRLAAWAMAWPQHIFKSKCVISVSNYLSIYNLFIALPSVPWFITFHYMI